MMQRHVLEVHALAIFGSTLGLQGDIFVAFLRANLLGYGGGPSTIPLIEREVVDRFHWLAPDEFADALAVGNSLPGPIATKLAAFVGFKVGGWLGAASALFATVAPTALVMTVAYLLLVRWKNLPFVAGMLAGAKPVVWALFVMLAIDYVGFVIKPWPALIALGSLVLLYAFHLHPALVMLGGLLVGGLLLR